jgi:hypothetical protein
MKKTLIASFLLFAIFPIAFCFLFHKYNNLGIPTTWIPEGKDIVSLYWGAVLSIIVTLLTIFFFRPKICIKNPIISDSQKSIKFPIRNIDCLFSVTNLRVEAAVVKDNYTYHFKFEREDFIMLNKFTKCNIDNTSPYERNYLTSNVSDELIANYPDENYDVKKLIDLLNQSNAYLRVRVHCYHEFTGFGKAFETNFRYNNGTFIKL